MKSTIRLSAEEYDKKDIEYIKNIKNKVLLGGIMKLTVIRHAESIYNEKGLFQGQVDCELSERGIEETKQKSKEFPTDFDICFCSPLKRTRQTAEILVPYSDIIYDKRIMERKMGEWENTPVSDEKRYLLNNNEVPSSIETLKELDKRVIEFLDMVKKNYHKQNVLVITHGGIIHSIHRVLGLKSKDANNLEMIAIEI